MIQTFKISLAAVLIAAAAVSFLPTTSNAGPYGGGGAYWHRHDDKGW
jgi:hypothetical protein